MRIVPLLTLLLLVSSSGCKNSFPTPLIDSKDTSFVIETKSLSIGPEKLTADYGTITVPENRESTSSRLIHLPFLRIHSISKNPSEPIFALTGGPGNSNMSWDLETMLPLLENHDFVLVGYRGVDGSSILDCPEVTEAVGEGDPLNEESMKKIGLAWNAAAQRLATQSVDVNGYTMLECISDQEVVRRALGYSRLNLLSRSYGTRVAYLYGLKYPASIFRSAMISVNPPGRFVWDANKIDQQLRYYSGLWSKDPMMKEKSTDLYLTLKRVLEKMPESWLGIPIVPGKVKVVTFAMLYHRQTAAQVFDAFVSAEKGDASGLAMMSVACDFVLPSLMVWGDATKAISADFDSTRNYSLESEPTAASPLGSPMNKLLWGPMNYGRLPIKIIPEEFRKLQTSEVETLLISGSVDFSTPAEYATNELLPFLKNGKQVIISECGHTGDILNPKIGNAVPLVKQFYQNGSEALPVNSYIHMSFAVKVGFPLIAKVVLVVVPTLVILVITVLVRIWRKYFKRGTST